MERRRFGQVGRLKPEKRDEYVRLHAEVWPDVLNMITACNLENYSIFIRGNVVFSYFEYTGTDYEADMAKMAADESTQSWCRCLRRGVLYRYGFYFLFKIIRRLHHENDQGQADSGRRGLCRLPP